MPQPVSISKSRLVTYLQCPKRLWLEQYNPELEEPSDEMEALLETGVAVGNAAKQVFGATGGAEISQQRGLRHAIEQTRALLESGYGDPLFEATFEHDGVVVQTDIYVPTERRIIEVKASTRAKEQHIADCAIQSWVVAKAGYEVDQILLAHIDNDFVLPSDGRIDDLFAIVDVTQDVTAQSGSVESLIAGARETLQSLDEPTIRTGTHCSAEYQCPFIEHCMPQQDEFPVTSLGGNQNRVHQWINEGYRDLREIPEAELTTDTQKRIWTQTTNQQAYVGDELERFATALETPRYYLDFETVAFAIPIWEGTRPYEALPFQWSCHIQRNPTANADSLEHIEFLELSGMAPLRRCAETLLDNLSAEGPILIYTNFEKTIVEGLAKRFEDLSDSLRTLADRMVDLHAVTKSGYYHPQMQGSWSIKSVLRTIPTQIDYSKLAVRDGRAAQRAYLEAIAESTTASRRSELENQLRLYCRYDTLAMVDLVSFFTRGA